MLTRNDLPERSRWKTRPPSWGRRADISVVGRNQTFAGLVVLSVVVAVVAIVVADTLQPALQFQDLKRRRERGNHRTVLLFSTSGQLAGIS
jgi:hypothetical protein